MILEADEKMKIGGKEYEVRFTVKSIFNLEKELGESLLVTLGRLQNGVTIPLHTVYSLLRWGLTGGGTVLSDDELDNLFTQLMAEGKFTSASVTLFKAIAKSGAIGDPKKIMAVRKKT